MADSNGEEGSMGFLIGLILCAVIFCGMLPLIGMMYYDILEVKNQVQVERKRLELFKQKLEKEKNADTTINPN